MTVKPDDRKEARYDATSILLDVCVGDVNIEDQTRDGNAEEDAGDSNVEKFSMKALEIVVLVVKVPLCETDRQADDGSSTMPQKDGENCEERAPQTSRNF